MIGGVQLPLFIVLVAVSGAAASTGAGSLLPDELHHSRPIARRETSWRSEVVLGATGEVLEKAESTSFTDPPTDGNSKPPLGDSDMCNMNFVEGKPRKQECLDANTHQIILDEDVCHWAANATGFESKVREDFEVLHEDYTKYPRGCLKKPCTDEPNAPECFFYNNNGFDGGVRDISKDLTGTPVCFRDRYKNGLVLTGTAEASQCLGDYLEITEESECFDLDACMDLRAADKFRIDEETSNVWEYNFFPRGCFINTDDQKLYWNQPQTEAPTAPKGTSICKSPPGIKKALIQ